MINRAKMNDHVDDGDDSATRDSDYRWRQCNNNDNPWLDKNMGMILLNNNTFDTADRNNDHYNGDDDDGDDNDHSCWEKHEIFRKKYKLT